jgi:hypothetical protein
MLIVPECVEKQAVVDIEHNIIGSKKTSRTEIGFEMEIDAQFYEKEGYPERYYDYEKAFGHFVGKNPTAYYAGTPQTLLRSLDIIEKFYK